MENDAYKLVVAVVNFGFADEVMESARDAGATGGTVIKGKGTGSKMFLGMSIEPEKELILILVKKEKAKDLLLAIAEHAGLKTPGQGIAFALPVDQTVGLLTDSADNSEE